MILSVQIQVKKIPLLIFALGSMDGNKRTGFVAGVLYLACNGFGFAAAEAAAAEAVLSLASGTLEKPGYTGNLRGNVVQPGS